MIVLDLGDGIETVVPHTTSPALEKAAEHRAHLLDTAIDCYETGSPTVVAWATRDNDAEEPTWLSAIAGTDSIIGQGSTLYVAVQQYGAYPSTITEAGLWHQMGSDPDLIVREVYSSDQHRNGRYFAAMSMKAARGLAPSGNDVEAIDRWLNSTGLTAAEQTIEREWSVMDAWCNGEVLTIHAYDHATDNETSLCGVYDNHGYPAEVAGQLVAELVNP